MATLRKSRSGIITSKMSEYINEDIKDSEHYVGRLNTELVKVYEEEHLLTDKVEEFLDEINRNLTNGVNRCIVDNRGKEKDAAIANNDKSTFDTQDKEFEKNIDELFHTVGDFLDRLRTQVEFSDKDQSEISRRTRILLEDCKNGIGDSYKTNSKKMMEALEKALQECIDKKDSPSNPEGEDR
jgi:hypothetical protein